MFRQAQQPFCIAMVFECDEIYFHGKVGNTPLKIRNFPY